MSSERAMLARRPGALGRRALLATSRCPIFCRPQLRNAPQRPRRAPPSFQAEGARSAGGATAVPRPASSSSSSSSSAVELKAALLEAVTKANNASLPSEAAAIQSGVEELAGQLAALNPTHDPVTSPLISGSWALVYTGPSAVLAPAAFGAAAPADSLKRGAQQALQEVSDAAYKFFYRFFPLIAGSAVGRRSAGSSKASNVQAIDLAAGRVDNIARFKLGSSAGEINVSGDAEAVPAEQTGGRAVRLRVTFRFFTLKLGGAPKLSLPLNWLSPVGFVDTLYLDQQMRVSVGDKGSLFVVTRVGGSGGPLGT